MSVPAVRALVAADAASVRALVLDTYGASRQLVRVQELIELALGGGDPECLGLVATADDGTIAGVLLYGTIGGAAGVVRVHALAGVTPDTLTVLLERVCDASSAPGARMFICELSDDPEHAPATRALVSHGFTLEASIADYFADGFPLDLLVLRL